MSCHRNAHCHACRARQLIAALVCLLLASGHRAAAAPAADTCVACHGALPAPMNVPVEGMKHDIHAEKGLSCVDCHGGDATVMDATAMAPEKGFRGKPEPAAIPDFCGHCHADAAYMRRFNPSLATDQLAQYWTSIHGQRLRQGDIKVATCVGCHGVHGILPADRAQSRVYPANVSATCGGCHSNIQYMAPYRIPTTQEAQYRTSVHGKLVLRQRDFSAPTCNTCHGNHGAYPPNVDSIAGVCGQCHSATADLFLKSPHKAAFDQLRLPQCVVCHGNHAIDPATDALLGTGESAVCRRCHDPGSAGYAGASRMRDAIDRLNSVVAETAAMLDRAKAMGMEVSNEQYTFEQDVRPVLVHARNETHAVDVDQLVATVQAGVTLATRNQASAQATLREAENRRRNLLFPVSAIVILMVLLYAKLRQLERRGGGGAPR